MANTIIQSLMKTLLLALIIDLELTIHIDIKSNNHLALHPLITEVYTDTLFYSLRHIIHTLFIHPTQGIYTCTTTHLSYLLSGLTTLSLIDLHKFIENYLYKKSIFMLNCNMTFIQYKIYVYIVFLGLNFLNNPTFCE